jgi:K+-transporting ATPase KdpF subunit
MRAIVCVEENVVSFESAAMVAICLLLTVYLVWALLRPEDF